MVPTPTQIDHFIANWANHLRLPFLHQHKMQIPPLRFAPVGMTRWRVELHLGSGGGGSKEPTNNGSHTYAD